MTARKLFSALLPLCLFCGAAFSADKAVLAEAAERYKNGDFADALRIYDGILQKDPGDPYALYNAGNCLYKQGDQTGALIRYLKAFKRLPRDRDIRYNLEFAAKQTGQTLFSADIPQVFYSLYYFFSDAELKALYNLFLSLSFLALSFVFWERFKTKAGTALAACLALFIFFFFWSALRKNSFFYSAGVVSAQEARILSGPGDNFKVSATIPRSRIVRIMDDSDEYYFEAGLVSEGMKGWISREEITKI